MNAWHPLVHAAARDTERLHARVASLAATRRAGAVATIEYTAQESRAARYTVRGRIVSQAGDTVHVETANGRRVAAAYAEVVEGAA